MAEEPTAPVPAPEPGANTSSTVPDANTPMHVKVYSPFHVYFDGTAESVTSENDTGEFDILGHHKNFLTLLHAGNIIVRSGDKEEKVEITSGVMHVKADEVIVFLDV